MHPRNPTSSAAGVEVLRLQKVLRNYAMEYITSIVPETIAVLGPEEGGHLAGAAARLVGITANKSGRVFSAMPWRFVDYWAMTHDADLNRYHLTKA